MQRLTIGARAIVHLLKTRGAGAAVLLHEFNPLFADEPLLLERAIEELESQAFVLVRDDGSVVLSDAGARLELPKGATQTGAL
jgi:hypothetical protein